MYLTETTNLLSKDRSSVTSVLKKLQNIKKLAKINIEKSYNDCVQLAVDTFQFCFNFQIQQLLNLFPADHIDS